MAQTTITTSTTETTEEKVYSVQFRRYGEWLACKGRTAKASYRPIAFTDNYAEARLMAATKCVDRAVIRAMLALAETSVIPETPVDYTVQG